MGGIVVDALHRLPKIDFGDKVDRLTQQVAGLVIHKLTGEVENQLSVRIGILHGVVVEDSVFTCKLRRVDTTCTAFQHHHHGEIAPPSR